MYPKSLRWVLFLLFLLIALSIFLTPLDLNNLARQTPQQTQIQKIRVWVATWNQPCLAHICQSCKRLGTSWTNLLCSRKNQVSHLQWTCGSPFLEAAAKEVDCLRDIMHKKPQKWIACVCAPPCIKSRQHPKHFPTSPLGQYCAGSLLLDLGGPKRSGAFRRIWPSAAVGKLLGT